MSLPPRLEGSVEPRSSVSTSKALLEIFQQPLRLPASPGDPKSLSPLPFLLSRGGLAHQGTVTFLGTAGHRTATADLTMRCPSVGPCDPDVKPALRGISRPPGVPVRTLVGECGPHCEPGLRRGVTKRHPGSQRTLQQQAGKCTGDVQVAPATGPGVKALRSQHRLQNLRQGQLALLPGAGLWQPAWARHDPVPGYHIPSGSQKCCGSEGEGHSDQSQSEVLTVITPKSHQCFSPA